MPASLTAKELFDAYQAKLHLTWLAGHAGADRSLQRETVSEKGAATSSILIGHMNLIHSNRIQVVGYSELEYLRGLGKNSYNDTIKQLFEAKPVFVVVSGDERVPPGLTQASESTGTPLLSTSVSSYKLINELQYFFSNVLAEKITTHGVFMEVMGIGVLLTGKSGVGKSELALELISHGHRLIADDAPEFSRVAPDTLNGKCPPALSGFLEVRGLGVLNVHAMFGDSAIKKKKNLRLIIHLKQMDAKELASIDRLMGSRQTVCLLDTEVPQVTLPVAPGHNLAVLVEGAVRNHVLLLKGYDAVTDFIGKQQALMNEGE